MSRLLTDVADLAGYAEPGTAKMDLYTLPIARKYAGLWQNSTHRYQSATVGKPQAISDNSLVFVCRMW